MRSGRFPRIDPLKSDSSSSAVSSEENRRNSANVVTPIVRAISVAEAGVGPGQDAERAGGHDEPAEHEPAHQARRDDLLLLRPRRDLHEALARLAVAEADGLEDVDA